MNYIDSDYKKELAEKILLKLIEVLAPGHVTIQSIRKLVSLSVAMANDLIAETQDKKETP